MGVRGTKKKKKKKEKKREMVNSARDVAELQKRLSTLTEAIGHTLRSVSKSSTEPFADNNSSGGGSSSTAAQQTISASASLAEPQLSSEVSTASSTMMMMKQSTDGKRKGSTVASSVVPVTALSPPRPPHRHLQLSTIVPSTSSTISNKRTASRRISVATAVAVAAAAAAEKRKKKKESAISASAGEEEESSVARGRHSNTAGVSAITVDRLSLSSSSAMTAESPNRQQRRLVSPSPGILLRPDQVQAMLSLSASGAAAASKRREAPEVSISLVSYLQEDDTNDLSPMPRSRSRSGGVPAAAVPAHSRPRLLSPENVSPLEKGSTEGTGLGCVESAPVEREKVLDSSVEQLQLRHAAPSDESPAVAPPRETARGSVGPCNSTASKTRLLKHSNESHDNNAGGGPPAALLGISTSLEAHERRLQELRQRYGGDDKNRNAMTGPVAAAPPSPPPSASGIFLSAGNRSIFSYNSQDEQVAYRHRDGDRLPAVDEAVESERQPSRPPPVPPSDEPASRTHTSDQLHRHQLKPDALSALVITPASSQPSTPRADSSAAQTPRSREDGHHHEQHVPRPLSDWRLNFRRVLAERGLPATVFASGAGRVPSWVHVSKCATELLVFPLQTVTSTSMGSDHRQTPPRERRESHHFPLRGAVLLYPHGVGGSSGDGRHHPPASIRGVAVGADAVSSLVRRQCPFVSLATHGIARTVFLLCGGDESHIGPWSILRDTTATMLVLQFPDRFKFIMFVLGVHGALFPRGSKVSDAGKPLTRGRLLWMYMWTILKAAQGARDARRVAEANNSSDRLERRGQPAAAPVAALVGGLASPSGRFRLPGCPGRSSIATTTASVPASPRFAPQQQRPATAGHLAAQQQQQQQQAELPTQKQTLHTVAVAGVSQWPPQPASTLQPQQRYTTLEASAVPQQQQGRSIPVNTGRHPHSQAIVAVQKTNFFPRTVTPAQLVQYNYAPPPTLH
jgi:hypothetical protein